MSSETTIAATQYRLQEWAAQIRDCQNRPADVSIVEWCAQNGITKSNYYYRLRRVRAACLKAVPNEMCLQQVVPVKSELLQQEETGRGEPGLDISIKGFSIHVTESTPAHLLAAVLEVIQNAE